MANLLGENKKDKILDNGFLRIEGNLFTTESRFIQISNISQVFAEKLPTIPYTYPIIMGIVGIIMLSMPRSGAVPGIIFLIFACISGYIIYTKNTKNKYGLFLTLNSGESIIYRGPDLTFLKDVANVLANIVKGNITGNYTINFTSNQIMNATGNIVNGGQIENLTYNELQM